VLLAALAGAAFAEDPARLVICADPLNMPYSEQGADPPGFDVEIGQMLAKELKRKFTVYWADTGTRGGLSRALRRSIAAKECDAFMSIPLAPQLAGELAEMNLTLTRPYMTAGLAIAQRASEAPIRDFEQLGLTKTGVQLGTLAEGAVFNRRFPMERYHSTEEALAGLEKNEVGAALLFGPMAAWSIQQNHREKLKISSAFEPKADWQWSLAIAVRQQDQELKTQLDEALGRMLADKRIAAVLAKYGVPFKSPE
jgi:polar amino acid transport system substrate-binding protein